MNDTKGGGCDLLSHPREAWRILLSKIRSNHFGAEQRRWWEVRLMLWGALLGVCATGAFICSVPEMRSSLRVTISEPLVRLVNGAAGWSGWPALAWASMAGVLTLPLARRMGLGRSLPRLESIYRRMPARQ